MLELSMEKNFIEILENQGYIYRSDIRTIDALNKNFREKIEYWNKINLSDREFNRILDGILGKSVFESSEILNDKLTLLRDDDTKINIILYNYREWCQNTFEVVNQLSMKTMDSSSRYDVLILINGLPLVHIELKNYKVSPRKAMEQIHRYKTNNAKEIAQTLLGFTQIFIMSNQTYTSYFVNNDLKYFKIKDEQQSLPVFTWANEHNKKMNDLLTEFSPSFLEKCFLSRMISRFIVRVKTLKQLMILRPYQVHAVDNIIRQVNESKSNGFIWHTTGSGKTLTSFKCATILRDNPLIHKILFVVDRKDLDKQTIDEFNKFEEGCVNQTENTNQLLDRMLNPAEKVVVTTLQKLNRLLGTPNANSSDKAKEFLSNRKDQLTSLHDKKIVFIFDECHRSQFGESNRIIRETFKNCQMFGFTGTPIFKENSLQLVSDESKIEKITTEHIFGDKLHQYLIHDAIDDKNVLKFQISYIKGEEFVSINSPTHKKSIVTYILENHGKATVDRQFTSIFATNSISDAIEYYQLFERMQSELGTTLNITAIFSPPPSIKTDLQDDLENEKNEYSSENADDGNNKKSALEHIIVNYNALYSTSFDINSADDSRNFMGYYGNVSTRIKNHDEFRTDKKGNKSLDLVIVVDMLLTGFDSKFINTMYIDKSLKYHGLVQAFSRTNRIYNAQKPHGNIYCFRDLKENVDDAIRLFSGKEKQESECYWLAESPEELKNKIRIVTKDIQNVFEKDGLEFKASAVVKLSHFAKKEFYEVFQDYVKLQNIAKTYINEDMSDVIDLLPESKAVHRAFLEDRHNPYDTKNPELTPTTDPELDIVYELFRKDYIDVEYIENLIADMIVEKSKRIDITAQDLAKEIAEEMEIDISNFDYSSKIIEYIKTGATQKQTKAEIIAGMRAFVKEEQDEKLHNFARVYGLDIEPLFTLVKEYNVHGKIRTQKLVTDAMKPWDLVGLDLMIKKSELEPSLHKLLDELREHYLQFNKDRGQ